MHSSRLFASSCLLFSSAILALPSPQAPLDPSPLSEAALAWQYPGPVPLTDIDPDTLDLPAIEASLAAAGLTLPRPKCYKTTDAEISYLPEALRYVSYDQCRADTRDWVKAEPANANNQVILTKVRLQPRPGQPIWTLRVPYHIDRKDCLLRMFLTGPQTTEDAHGRFNVDFLTLTFYIILRECARVSEDERGQRKGGSGGYFIQQPGDPLENRIELRPVLRAPSEGGNEGVPAPEGVASA